MLYSPLLSQGILGSLKSGKSALVNKYITGSYAAVEKPDGKNKCCSKSGLLSAKFVFSFFFFMTFQSDI